MANKQCWHVDLESASPAVRAGEVVYKTGGGVVAVYLSYSVLILAPSREVFYEEWKANAALAECLLGRLKDAGEKLRRQVENALHAADVAASLLRKEAAAAEARLRDAEEPASPPGDAEGPPSTP